MNEQSNGLILNYKCQNEECSYSVQTISKVVGYTRCELTRFCSTVFCDLCESPVSIEELNLINSKLKFSGMKELKREHFNLFSNNKSLINLKINQSSIAYADITVTPYDQNSETEEINSLEYLKFCTEDIIMPDSLTKTIFFEHLCQKKR